jgi:hemerythrin-like metal-binding protein/diguanylate cyclase (GGDEF)-like protein
MSPIFHSSGTRCADPALALARSGLVPFAVLEQGFVVATSQVLRDLLGITTPLRPLEGSSFLEHVASADRTAVAHFLDTAMHEENRTAHRCHMIMDDGTEFAVLLAASSVTTGEARQAVVCVTDLSPWIDPAAGGANVLAEPFDGATGFPTQALLLDRMNVALAAARRYRRRSAVLRIELRRFEEALRNHVSQAGEMQSAVAEALRNCSRECDTFARIGAGEFVLLVPEINHRDDAGVLAARIVEAVLGLASRNAPLTPVSAHIGISLYPTDGASPAQLLHAAKDALGTTEGMLGGGFALADATHTELATFHLLEFREEYLVGIDAIDATHRALVERTNELVRHLQGGADPLLLDHEIADLIELLAAHFADEAQLLDPSPYAGAVDQRSRNLRFLDELRCILLHVNAQSVTLAVRHLYDWLIPHLVTTESRRLLQGEGQADPVA